VAVGDTLELPTGAHVVAGIWRAGDTADPAWFSETLVASGRLDDAVGPVIVADEELSLLEVRPRVSWTLVPRGVDAAALSSLVPVEARVRAATGELASGTSYAVTVTGDLSDTLARARTAVASARVLDGTAVVLALVISGIVLALVGRSLAQLRSVEGELLAARGLSPARAAAWGLGEAALVVGLGSAAGIAAGMLLASAADAPVPPGSLVAAVAAGLAGIVLFALAARPVPVERGHRAAAETDSIVPALAVTVLAGFAIVTANAVPASPVRYAVPALVLVAGVLLLRLPLAPGMRVAERGAARGAGLLPVLPLRQLGRRPRAVAAAFVEVALAAGAVVAAGLAQGTVARAHDADVRSSVGGELRIRFADVDRDPVTAAPYARLEGVTAATEIALVTAQAGSASTEVVVAGEGFDAVTGVRPPAAGEDELSVRITPSLASGLGVALGDEVLVSVTGVRTPIAGVIAEIGAVPGIRGAGMLVARDALAVRLPAEQAALVIDEVWLASAAPDTTAALARSSSTRAATVLTPSGAGSLAVAETAVVATTASAALAVLMGLGGLGAAAAGLRRMRRGEVTPLRALGMGAASQARGRFVESVATSVAGVIVGAVAGSLAMWFATGAGFSAADLTYPAPLLLGGVLLLGALGIAAGAALAVRRDAEARS
jgi:hypothetical protein